MEKMYQFNWKNLRLFMRNADITPSEKCVLVNLMLYAGKDGIAFPSQNTLGKDMGFSERQVRNCLVSLKNKGFIKWEKRGYSKSNQYSISKELYFLVEEKVRQSVSYHSRTSLPKQPGIQLPAKDIREKNHIKKGGKPPCGDCTNGWVFGNESTARQCICQQ